MRKRVLDVLKSVLPDADFEGSDRLVTDGIIDSMSLMSMVVALSGEFNVELGFQDITIENFNSLDNIVNMVKKYL